MDACGAYRLDGVPAGTVQATLFYAGIAPLTRSVAVVANQTAQRDVALTAAGPTGARADVVKLDQFVVPPRRK